MTRAPLVLGATAAGLAATLAFNPHPAATTPATTTAATAAAPPRSTAAASASSSGTRTGTGAAMTQYGEVALRVTVAGGRITKVQALALPQTDPKSAEISAYAEPLLRRSALSKQSGSVDAVSGATYTSAGYQQALQAALDRAGFAKRSASVAAGRA